MQPPVLLAEVDPAKAKHFPNHIVISSELVRDILNQNDTALTKFCESYVDAFFYLLVNKSGPGIFLPASAADDDSSKSASSPAHLVATSDEDEAEKEKLIKQSGGKQAIVKAMHYHLDEEFIPFLLNAMDPVVPDRGAPEPREDEEEETNVDENKQQDGDDNKLSKKELPPVGCVFNKRGELLTMGSLSACGAGVGGIFMNGV